MAACFTFYISCKTFCSVFTFIYSQKKLLQKRQQSLQFFPVLHVEIQNDANIRPNIAIKVCPRGKVNVSTFKSYSVFSSNKMLKSWLSLMISFKTNRGWYLSLPIKNPYRMISSKWSILFLRKTPTFSVFRWIEMGYVHLKLISR